MEIVYASVPAPDVSNEDYVVTGPGWVVVLDGATHRPGVDSGCVHTVTWLVEQLAASLARSLTLPSSVSLIDAVATAIGETRAAHEGTCDVSNPDSPSSTVAILRERADVFEHLVLGDSPILFDIDGEVKPVLDERSAHLPSYTAEGVRSHRNQPHGFWIASTKPEAAQHAVTGSTPKAGVRRVAVMTDGVSRYVERLGLGDWAVLLDALDKQGPVDVIDQIRAAERAQLPELGHEPNGRRVKRHDDATAVIIRSW